MSVDADSVQIDKCMRFSDYVLLIFFLNEANFMQIVSPGEEVSASDFERFGTIFCIRYASEA